MNKRSLHVCVGLCVSAAKEYSIEARFLIHYSRFDPIHPLTLSALASLREEYPSLSLSPSSVSRIVERGENILDHKKNIAVKITDMEI